MYDPLFSLFNISKSKLTKVSSPVLFTITVLFFLLNHFSIPRGFPRPSTPGTRHCIKNRWPLSRSILSLTFPAWSGISNLSGSGLSRMKYKTLYKNLKPFTLTRFSLYPLKYFVVILKVSHWLIYMWILCEHTCEQ